MVRLNKSELKWLIILAGFTYFTYSLLSTGKIYYFIHPKMLRYVRFSFAAFFILTILQLKNIFKVNKNENKRKISFGVFLLPLILGLFLNPQQLSSEIASKKGVSILQSNVKTTTSKSEALAVTDDALVIDSSNFSEITDDIMYSAADKYKGKTITITGFVYRDETFSKKEFVAARLMMICCAADTAVVGLLCDWDNTATLKNNDWYKVTGIMDTKVHEHEGKEETTPFVKVQKVEVAQKPENQYVYPE